MGVNSLMGQTTYTASSGDWDGSGSIWTPSGVPTSIDHVIIPAGVSVKMETSATTVASLTLAGTLDLDKGDDDLTVTGDVTITGASAVLLGDKGNSNLIVNGNLILNSGQQLTIQKTSVQVDGTTTLNGNLTFDDDDGTYQFNDININSAGTWNNADKGDFTITGNLVNDGTFTGCSSATDCIYEFTSSSGSISGNNPITISDLVINSPASVTSTATIIVTDDFSGTGTFTNGNGSSLELQNSVGLDVSNLDFSTNSNDLIFAGTADASLPAGTYHNIEVNFSDDKKKLNMDANVTINNDLTLTDGKIEADAGSVITVGGDLTVGANSDEFKLKDSNFTVSGNVTMDGGKIKTDDNTSQFNVTGNVTVNSGTLELKKGNTDISGDLNVSGGDFNLGGNKGAETANLNVDGESSFTTNGTVEFVQGDFDTGDFTVGSGTTVSINEGVSVDASGNSNIEGTIDFEDAGNTPTWAFTDLVINSASGMTLTNNISVSGTLIMQNGNLILGSNNLEMLDGSTISGGSSSSFIQVNGSGVIRQFITSAGATLNFPVGNTAYSPITSFTLNSATIGAGAYLDINLTETGHPNRDTDNTGSNGDDDGTAATAYLNRFWTLSANNITSPAYSLSAVYNQSDVVGTESNLVGALYRSVTFGGSTFLDWLETGVVNPSTNNLTISGGDNWGDIYAMDNTMERLPVELIHFEVFESFGQVKLEWETALEVNNEFYSIERSRDGKEYQVVGTVMGAGNSDEFLKYHFVDPFPLKGRSYYRLKQTDFSGVFEYSEVRSVMVSEPAVNQIKISPTLTQAGATIGIVGLESLGSARFLRAILVDLSGRQIELNVSNGEIILPSNISPNVYVIRLVGDSGTHSQRIIVN